MIIAETVINDKPYQEKFYEIWFLKFKQVVLFWLCLVIKQKWEIFLFYSVVSKNT